MKRERPGRYILANCPKCGHRTLASVNPLWLRKRRQLSGISQILMAEICGVSVSMMAMIENGGRSCNARIEEAYASLPTKKELNRKI